MIQCQVLNYILRENDTSFVSSNSLDTSYFSDYREEFKFIAEHIREYNKVPDMYTFVGKFPHFDVIEVTESPKYLINELVEDRSKRHLAYTFNKIRDCINSNKVDEALRIYTQSMETFTSTKTVNSIDILRDTKRFDAYVDKCNDWNKYYVKTGFKELDDIIGGWDRTEELATLSARPGVGKSWCVLKCAVAAAEQGLRVGIYSGEMSENLVGYRIDTLISHISNRGILRGMSELQPQYKKYLESVANNIKGTIRVLTPNMIGGPAGVQALKTFVEKDNLDILFVDQHSLLEDDRKAKNPVERAANISKDLKNLQVKMRIPIVAVSQQNRNSTEEGTTTAHIAQSDRIAQDSTIVIFFEQKDGVLSLNLAKSRNSESNKTIKYALDFDKGIFSYVPTETDALSGADCNKLRDMYEGSTTDFGEDAF